MLSKMWKALPALCWLSSLVEAALVQHDDSFIPDHVLRVSTQNYAQACYFRNAAVVNGTSPGPPIYLKPNVTSWVRVYNDMPDQNLTMHWHGLSQSSAPFSDGTPYASQWPIPPLHYFDYELHPGFAEAGTYFYHSHVGFQANSVNGPLIVEDDARTGSPFDYDDEKIFEITEFWNETDAKIIAGLLATPQVWTGEALAFFVNGRSIAAVNMSEPVQTQQNCGYEVFEVKPNMTYRFRFIGAMALSLMTLGFEDHNLSIIAADASYTQPAQTEYLQVGSGQRFDALLTTKSEADLQSLGKKNFWIQIEPRARPSNLVSYACLSYDGAGCGSPPTTPPLVLPANFWDFMEYELAPLVPNDFPSASEVTRRVTLRIDQILNRDGFIAWPVDNNTWYEDSARTTPWLVDIYKYGQSALPNITVASSNDSYIGNGELYMASLNDVVEIVLINEPNGHVAGFDVHPFHLHGSHFYDLGSGYGDYDADANNAKLASLSHTPVRRDTTVLYKYTAADDAPPTTSTEPGSAQGWRAWRFRVDDPGVWMLHCHTLHHMISGMQTVWAMGSAQNITRDVVPGDVQGYLAYGGSVYGNETWYPVVNHFNG